MDDFAKRAWQAVIDTQAKLGNFEAVNQKQIEEAEETQRLTNYLLGTFLIFYTKFTQLLNNLQKEAWLGGTVTKPQYVIDSSDYIRYSSLKGYTGMAVVFYHEDCLSEAAGPKVVLRRQKVSLGICKAVRRDSKLDHPNLYFETNLWSSTYEVRFKGQSNLYTNSTESAEKYGWAPLKISPPDYYDPYELERTFKLLQEILLYDIEQRVELGLVPVTGLIESGRRKIIESGCSRMLPELERQRKKANDEAVNESPFIFIRTKSQ